MNKRNVDAIFLYTVMTEFNRLDNRIRQLFVTWLVLMEGVRLFYKNQLDGNGLIPIHHIYKEEPFVAINRKFNLKWKNSITAFEYDIMVNYRSSDIVFQLEVSQDSDRDMTLNILNTSSNIVKSVDINFYFSAEQKQEVDNYLVSTLLAANMDKNCSYLEKIWESIYDACIRISRPLFGNSETSKDRVNSWLSQRHDFSVGDFSNIIDMESRIIATIKIDYAFARFEIWNILEVGIPKPQANPVINVVVETMCNKCDLSALRTFMKNTKTSPEIAYWLVEVVNTFDASKQKIISLKPTCRQLGIINNTSPIATF